MDEIYQYILNFLTNGHASLCWYGCMESAPSECFIIILPSGFFNDDVYGQKYSLPKEPFSKISGTDIPFLFGKPAVENFGNRIVLSADLVASTYFLLSRYEEWICKERRDEHGRFLSDYSVIKRQNCLMRPLVDEWGRYLRGLLRERLTEFPKEKVGFNRIYLTHDIDIPFMFNTYETVVKQLIKNLIHRGEKISHPFHILRTAEGDPFYTFPWMLKIDNSLVSVYPDVIVSCVYFLIAAGNKKTKNYADVHSEKYKSLLNLLSENGVDFGLHISYEGGENSTLIKSEVQRLKKILPNKSFNTLLSRHHYLRWAEPEQIVDMEMAGITDDFTLGFPDSVGFRVGTCRPYMFINPKTRKLTRVLIHPLEIMDATLGDEGYMNLNYSAAYDICIELFNKVKEFNGELNILWHNTSFSKSASWCKEYQKKLYVKLIDFLSDGYCK